LAGTHERWPRRRKCVDEACRMDFEPRRSSSFPAHQRGVGPHLVTFSLHPYGLVSAELWNSSSVLNLDTPISAMHVWEYCTFRNTYRHADTLSLSSPIRRSFSLLPPASALPPPLQLACAVPLSGRPHRPASSCSYCPAGLRPPPGERGERRKP